MKLLYIYIWGYHKSENSLQLLLRLLKAISAKTMKQDLKP